MKPLQLVWVGYVYTFTHLTLIYLLLTFIPQILFPENDSLITQLLILSVGINAVIIFITANTLCRYINPESLQGSIEGPG